MDPKAWSPYGIAFYVDGSYRRGVPVPNTNPSKPPRALFSTAMNHRRWCHLPVRLGKVQINDMSTKKKIKAVMVSDIDSGKALGGWHTFCTKEKPNR